MSQPSAEVIQGYPVQQQVTGVAVPQRVSADVCKRPRSNWPASIARFAASWTHREAAVRETSTRSPQLRIHGHFTGFSPPLLSRIRRVGRSVSRRRSRGSSARSSDTQSPARHCSKISSLAWELGAHFVGFQVLWQRGTFAPGRLLQRGAFGVHLARASPA